MPLATPANTEPDERIGARTEDANAIDANFRQRHERLRAAECPRRAGDDRATPAEIFRRAARPQLGERAKVVRARRVLEVPTVDARAQSTLEVWIQTNLLKRLNHQRRVVDREQVDEDYPERSVDRVRQRPMTARLGRRGPQANEGS